MASAAEEEAWCEAQRSVASDYLAKQPGPFGALGDWPAWHVTHQCAVWAVESVKSPGWVGWWVITGDLPTDYASSAGVRTPRDAVKVFADRWRDAASSMVRGEEPADISVGSEANRHELGALLASRAKMLVAWVKDDSVWNYA
jgi:hypothetical protein